MQPQELHPNLQTVVTPTIVQPTGGAQTSVQPQSATPVALPVAATTDQKIAHENAQVYIFEHGAPELPGRRKLLAFIGSHKHVLVIAIISFALVSAGAALAVVKLKSFTRAPGSQSSAVASGGESSSSAGGSTSSGATDSSSAEENNDTSSSDDNADSEDSGDDGNAADTKNSDDEGDDKDTGGSGASDGDSEEDTSSDTEDDGEPVVDDVESDTPVDTPAPTPIPSKPVTSLAHKFTTASWNSNADNTKVVGDQLLTIMNDSQIIGLQSLHKLSQRDSVKNKVICSTCKYAGYLPSYSDSKATQSSYPIVWDKAAFSQVGSGSWRKMCDALTTSSTTYATRYATWVRLQSKVNGKQIIIINTHLISGVESGGKPTSNTAQLDRYKTHMSNLLTLVNELKASNVPIYVVGNFSVNYRYDKNGYTSYFPYASLKPLGIRSNWDVMSLSGISNSTGTTTSDNHIVDYVFAWQRSDVTPNAITIASSSYGSSYKPVFFTTTIK